MAREGIYVGGHEIVERYVGDKLVWQKWRFSKRFSDLSYGHIYQHVKTQVEISANSGGLNNETYSTGTRKIKIINYSNYGTEVFYANGVHVYGTYSGESNYNTNRHLYIEFNTQQEASNFLERYHAGTLDIYI